MAAEFSEPKSEAHIFGRGKRICQNFEEER